MVNKEDELNSLKQQFSYLKTEYCALEENYNNLKKELEVANEDYLDVNKRWHHTIEEKDIAMKYIEKLLIENERIGEIIKFCLDYKRVY